MSSRIKRNKGTDLLQENYGIVKNNTYDFAILPWGATEPHNNHLPYVTDCYLAYAVAVDSVNKALDKHGVRGMVLPPIPLGSQNPGQTNQPFCLHGRYETQRLIMRDVIESLIRQGLKKLIIMNGHGGNNFKNMIRDFDLDYPDMVIACCEWFKVVPQKEYFELPDDHAGEMETSLMMYYYPELVHLETAGDGAVNQFNIEAFNKGQVWIPRHWEKIAPDTGAGDPRRATAEKGERYATDVTDALADFYFDFATKSIYK
ncbi:creatininase family protein [Dysgonomonas sp. 511]|uniref:creatininase family protein n=1 Tax=Dysgonomonas sp. 511 TaxID=2302930 RepID=UPI0013D7179E|nr:creatininase family protein [Dysgonomonas sp. 511]NDV78118.1 creatininase family protein [Dysgonomonas sp. 511]